MRIPSDMPAPRPRRPKGEQGSNRRRTLLIIGAIVAFFLFTSLRGIAGFYTDYLWFDSLGYDGVFTGVLGAKVALAAIFTAIFFVVCLANLIVADRLAPSDPPDGPEQEVFDRITETIGKRAGLVRAAIAFLLALLTGVQMSQDWRSWLLFTNGGDWGQTDAQFGRDLGFYVFKLPFLSSVADWAFASMLIVLVATIAAHFVNGGIRMQPVTPGNPRVGPVVTSQVKAHVSVLLGMLALIRAAGYYLERFELTTSKLGYVDGAGYTDINARLPVLNLLLLISVASFVLFIVNIRRRGWVLPVLGVGLWGLVAVIAAGIYPQVIQRLQVDPNELSRELPYIDRNIAATRDAMNLSGMESVDLTPVSDSSAVDLSDNEATISNVRLWDPGPEFLGQTFSRLEQLLPYYRINDVDVDRYEIDGEISQVVISARDLDTGGVPATSWEARHATYTHGYGLVMASATAKTSVGRPDFNLQQVPVQENSDLELNRPQLYFGEGLDSYVVTNTRRDEIDYEAGEQTETIVYDGADGVSVGGLVNRIAFSLRFADYNPLISDLIGGDSRIHYIRDIRERAETLAPFLRFDSDPYPVVDDAGNVKWILDAYTVTDRFPYGEVADTNQISPASGLDGSFNYIRNSVKAVVDAYDGSVDFYVIDDTDPIINAWRSAFPELFSDFADMPADLVDNIRYPEDLFRIQTNMWGRYHVANPTTFYNGNDAWNVALDPGDRVNTASPGIDPQTGEPLPVVAGKRVDPYYLLTELPGEQGAEFVMLRSFVPVGNDANQLLTSFTVARSDPEHYGELITYEMPRQDRPDGPALVGDSMQSDGTVSDLQTQLGQRGSEVLLGNIIVVPVDDALVWVRPFYVKSDGVQVPELEKVIVSFEGDVAVGDTLNDALGQLFDELPDVEEVVPDPDGDGSGDPDDPDAETPDPDEPDVSELSINEQAARLLEEANDLYAQAQDALNAGDLGEYQAKNDEANAKVDDALALLAPTTTTTTTTTVPDEET